MFTRVRSQFKDAKFARMSSGTYCIIRDLGLVKGGKGMRHHEVLVTFSLGALGRSIGEFVGVSKRRSASFESVRDGLRASVQSSAMTEEPSPR